MSLRDQLLKSGLASKQQAKKASREAKKKQHKAQKALNKGELSSEALKKDDIQKKITEEKAKQKELDRQRNLEILEAQKSYKATFMIYSEGEQEKNGRIPYYFKDLRGGTHLQVIYVSPQQQKGLATGKLGIATLNDGYWYLLKQEQCYLIRDLKPDLLVCLHDQVNS